MLASYSACHIGLRLETNQLLYITMHVYIKKIRVICYRYNTRKQQCRFKDRPGQQPILASGQSTPTVISPMFHVTAHDGDHNMLQMSADKTHSMIQNQDYIRLKPWKRKKMIDLLEQDFQKR